MATYTLTMEIGDSVTLCYDKSGGNGPSSNGSLTQGGSVTFDDEGGAPWAGAGYNIRKGGCSNSDDYLGYVYFSTAYGALTYAFSPLPPAGAKGQPYLQTVDLTKVSSDNQYQFTGTLKT